MRRNARCPQYPRPEVSAPRRGNSIVLVMGILVLLVIIATAFITRTHAGRVTANAMQRTTLRDDNARVIAEMLADEIAEALFVRPAAGPDSNAPRLAIKPDAHRYDFDPDFTANFAPYHVVPRTNWPDAVFLDNAYPGQYPDYVANPPPDDLPGNPGFGDTPWLRDTEPQRLALDALGPDNIPETGDEFEVFTHWTHLSNIARPNNGWRIVGDISNVENSLIADLNFPVEQWLPILWNDLLPGGGDYQYVPSSFNFTSSANEFTNQPQFEQEWFNWFFTYPAVFRGGGTTGIPGNFYKLNDLDGGFDQDGDGDFMDVGERPQDEFIRDRARWNVNRVLVDTDGDGFTDSFWFLSPTMIERGVRQIVAVSIVDNSGLLNTNVATRFIPDDPVNPAEPRTGTTGATPADLALVGELLQIPDPNNPPANWNVGFYDNLANWFVGPDNDQDGEPDYETRYDLPTGPSDDYPWKRHVLEVGLFDQFGVQGEAPNQLQRLDYWRRAGLTPLVPPVGSGYTPFTLAEELELRMFHGNNYPWIFSRYEFATQSVAAAPEEQFLRAKVSREESSEYLDQLTNEELLRDNRRKLTLFSGARNDLMPPWLWWPMDDVPQFIQNQGQPAIDNFVAQSRIKLDLRDPELVPPTPPPAGVLSFRQRLPLAMLRALTDGFDDQGETYYGPAPGFAGTIQRLAAAMAANTLAYRDDDTEAPLEEAVALPEFPGVAPAEPAVRFLGVERQPFLLEAFIGHVHASEALPDPPPPNVPPYTPLFGAPGNYVDDSHGQTTVVVVQIANPFDGEPRQDVNGDGTIDEIDLAIDLFDYSISVFGQTIDLATVVPPAQRYLRPGTAQRPRTAIFYSIESNFDGDAGFQDEWRDFLDLNRRQGADSNDLYFDPNLPSDRTILVDVNVPVPGWSTDRGVYDGFAAGYAIELLRKDPFNSTPVVVDRFDYEPGNLDQHEFRDAVANLFEPPAFEPVVWSTMPEQSTKPGIRIGDDDFWVTWTRVTREWGYDSNYDPATADVTAGIQPLERAPRFIFATQQVTTGENLFVGDQNAVPPDDGPDEPCGYCGDSYADAASPDDPWFEKTYADAPGPRKPTFFTMNPVFDGLTDIYPDFDAPNYEYGFYFYNMLYGPPPGNGNPPPGFGIPDKGFYHFSDSLQMLQKDGDFEQVGELLNVWLFGHELQFNFAGDYDETFKTFSEYMSDPPTAGTGRGVNRLGLGEVIGVSANPADVSDPLHAVPALPAGLRILDAFVCDGIGVNSPSAGEFLNAHRFTGKTTPGLININTAPVEVLRALPHLYKLVHADGQDDDHPGNPTLADPRTRLAEGIIQYRERLDEGPDQLRPQYADDAALVEPDRPGQLGITDLRPERGIASIGEVLLIMLEPADSAPGGPFLSDKEERSWLVDFAGLNPYEDAVNPDLVFDTDVSTDVIDVLQQNPLPPLLQPDGVAKDVEEANLLFAGMSNMITTRSDVFTVYFKVRSFKQNPTTGVWDATNPEFIVDDSRYVMLVDRSEVNHPNDKPKILYLEKLPK